MNLLIFPEYAYPVNHVVVNTVYETLLPAHGHTVHMIRPKAGATGVEDMTAPWPGSLRVYPAQPSAGLLANAVSLLRRRRWLREATATFDETPLDAVLVRNDLASAFAGLQLARRKRIPFVYQLSSPDAEFRLKSARQQGGVAGAIQQGRAQMDLIVRRRILRSADAVLAISDAMADYLIESDGLDPRRVFSFPMGVQNAARPAAVVLNDLRETLALPEGRTMVYSGVLDPVRDPNWMLDVFDRVRARVPDALFLVLTYQDPRDERRRAFETEAARRGGRVKVVGPLPHTDVQPYLACANVMLSAMPPMFELDISSPTKSIEGMAAGVPIVGSASNVEHRKVLPASGGGFAVDWDQAAFAEAIVTLLQDPARSADMGERGRQWVLRHRTYTHLTKYVEQIVAAAGSVTQLAALPHQPDREAVA